MLTIFPHNEHVKHCVYALIDPRSDLIFYIGQTSDLARRRAEHMEGSDQISGVLVRQIKLAGFLPLILVLERAATMTAALSAEIFWIELMTSRGADLLNAQSIGGYRARKSKRRALETDLAAMAGVKADTAALQAIANVRPPRHGKPWSAQEQRRLVGMKKAGMSPEAMADALGRSLADVKRRLRSH